MTLTTPTTSALWQPSVLSPTAAMQSPGIWAESIASGSWKLFPWLTHLDQVLTGILVDAIKSYETGRDTKTTVVVCSAPPQHGKSEYLSVRVPAWTLLQCPEWQVVLVSYTAAKARENSMAARTLIAEHGSVYARGRGVYLDPSSHGVGRWSLAGTSGGCVASGARGSITGFRGDLVILDDPFKDWLEAAKATNRNRVWDFWRSTIYTRLRRHAVVVVMHTRWHEDDLIGRLKKQSLDPKCQGMRWVFLEYPAIAKPDDVCGRAEGEPLCPQQYTLAALEERRAMLGSFLFSSMYQQDPQPAEGILFNRAGLRLLQEPPADISRVVRYWDKAATPGAGDYSAGVLMGAADGMWFVLDVVRGQWSAGDRERIIQQTAALDRGRWGGKLSIWLEQEPGSGGKESAERTVRSLAGYDVRSERVTGDKMFRARPFAAQVEAGNVRLLNREWSWSYLDELCGFPFAEHDDVVDASSGAFMKLAEKKKFVVGV